MTPARARALAAAGEGAEALSGALGAENHVEGAGARAAADRGEGAGEGAAAAALLPEKSTTAVGKTFEVVTIGCERCCFAAV